MTNYVHPSLAKRKVHLWIEGGAHAACGQPDGPLLRCSRRPFKVTCKRCERWYLHFVSAGLSAYRSSKRKEPTNARIHIADA